MGDVAPVGIVVGMAFEAKCLSAAVARHPELPTPLIEITGAKQGRAEEAARRLIAKGATALLSFGIAGGLDPALQPGDVVIADRIKFSGKEDIETDRDWREAVLAAVKAVASARTAPILLADHAVQSVEEKARLYIETGAVAVDMESYGVAREAATANIPVLAVRVIADTARRALPSIASGAIRPDGTVRLGPVLAGLLRHPATIVGLIGVGRDTGKAQKVLRRVAFRDLAALLRA
jgi:adenosylhomocysteine nucleosidase